MKFQINSPTVELERNEMFEVGKESLLIGQWKRGRGYSKVFGEREKDKWFDVKLIIENVDFQNILEVLVDHLGVKIVEEEEIV